MEREILKRLIEHGIKNNPQFNYRPVGFHCSVRWDEDGAGNEPSKGYEDVLIACVEPDTDTSSFPHDDEIIFYITKPEQLLELCEPDNGSDFQITGYFYSEKL